MKTVEGLDDLKEPLIKAVVTVGNFDGVHKGHQALMAKVRERAKVIGGTGAAVTFDPHPVKVLRPGNGPALLTSRERKEELIAGQGLDVLVYIKFTRELAALTARQFLVGTLVRRLGMKELVVGHDASFGSDRAGSLEFLARVGQEAGFLVHQVGPVELGGRVVSSSLVRELIEAGEVDEAAEFLGRPYQIAGEVVRGQDRGGRLMGFPTANLNLVQEVVPRRGVYAVRVTLPEGGVLPGVTNVGVNPTFGGQTLTVETFIPDFQADLYGRRLRLDFVKRLRDEMKFQGLPALKEQIERDVAAAREVLS